MLQSIVFHRVRLTKLCFKDLRFLSRTFADLPNIRGDAQQPNSPTRPAKPPDFSPVQQNGGKSSLEQQNSGPSSPVVRPPEPVLPDIRDPEGFSKKGSGTLLIAPDGTLPRISPEFRPIYLFPHIVKMRLACKLKLFQTFVISATLPICLSLMSKDLMSPSTVGIVLGVNLTAWTMLMLTGEIFRKFVGRIYLRHDDGKIVISHLNFFGGRTDTSVFVKDVIPLSESSENTDEIVWKLNLYDGRHFYMCTRAGGVLCKDGWEVVFGGGEVEDKRFSVKEEKVEEDGRGNGMAGKAENLTETESSREDLAPLSSKDKDTTYSPPLGSRKVTFLDSPSSPDPPPTFRSVNRRSLSPEARVQERLSPGEPKTEQNTPTPVRGPRQPWRSRRSRTLDPSQRLQDLGSGKSNSE